MTEMGAQQGQLHGAKTRSGVNGRCWGYLGVGYACYVRRLYASDVQCLLHQPDCVLLRMQGRLHCLLASQGIFLLVLHHQ